MPEEANDQQLFQSSIIEDANSIGKLARSSDRNSDDLPRDGIGDESRGTVTSKSELTGFSVGQRPGPRPMGCGMSLGRRSQYQLRRLCYTLVAATGFYWPLTSGLKAESVSHRSKGGGRGLVRLVQVLVFATCVHHVLSRSPERSKIFN